ncbi:MAG TPA: response regulator transcription factor [Mycobacteriales bacterium]|nr:response regulator transcription factor [Mycobacteriales bacterium]
MSVRVMVVDDTDHVRTMLTEMLTLGGFDVVASCAGADEAIARVDAANPQVVIMDLRMPDRDGLECTRELKARRPGQAVILYTAYLDDDTESSARDAGVALCVAKAGGLSELEREVSRLALEMVQGQDHAGDA